MDPEGDHSPEPVTDFFCLTPITGQNAVELDDVGCTLLDPAVLNVKRTLYRGGQQAEDKSGHRRNQAHRQIHDIPGILAQMMVGQHGADKHTEQRADEEKE